MAELNSASPVVTPVETTAVTTMAPSIEFSTVLIKDPMVQAALQQMTLQHKAAVFVGYEFAWIVVIWIFRAWRLTKASTLLTRIWTQAWIGFLFWVMAITAVPLLVWDGAYQSLLSQAAKLLLKTYFE